MLVISLAFLRMSGKGLEMTCVLASSRPGYENIAKRLTSETGEGFFYFSNNEELTVKALNKIKPIYVFFPHWSHIIPKEIYTNFECVMFHMTNLPFGRGGSPLQNLIARGIYETQITAFRCEKGLDIGPIYWKRPLSLYGTAEEIYLRAADIIEDMIKWIIANQPEPVPQQGEGCYFPRRKPEEGNIAELESLEKLYDYIRMLDAEGYPHAFLETKHFRLEFKRASLNPDYIKADVIIRRK
jgi:methionyl-tRNA formyltransferase